MPMNKLDGMGKGIEKRRLKLIFKLRQTLSSNLSYSKMARPIIVQINFLLTNIKNTKAIPAKLRKQLQWFNKHP